MMTSSQMGEIQLVNLKFNTNPDLLTGGISWAYKFKLFHGPFFVCKYDQIRNEKFRKNYGKIYPKNSGNIRKYGINSEMGNDEIYDTLFCKYEPL